MGKSGFRVFPDLEHRFFFRCLLQTTTHAATDLLLIVYTNDR